MHRTVDSVRPRHHQTAAAAHDHDHNHNHNYSSPSWNNNDGPESGRLFHKKRPSPASYKRCQWRQKRTILQKIVLVMLAAPLIHYVLLTSLVGSRLRSGKKSLWPATTSTTPSSSSGAIIVDPMQSLFLKPRPRQEQQANDQRGARQTEEEGHQKASSTTTTFDSSSGGDAAPVVVVGTFQGLPITYHETTTRFASSVHCVGENFQPDTTTSWMVRSCQFRNLCLDMKANDFVLFQSPEEEHLHRRVEKLQQRQQKRQEQKQQQLLDPQQQQQQQQHHFVTISSLALQNHTQVSLGSLSNLLHWTTNSQDDDDVNRFKWFPKVLPRSLLPSGYYQLPNDVVWVPFMHAPPSSSSNSTMKAWNLVWNDWFSIFTLLSMFDLLGTNDNAKDSGTKKPRLLLTRHVLQKEPLSAKSVLLEKFLPAMGIHHPPLQFSTNLDYQFSLFHDQQQQQQQSHLICARFGAAGLGMLSSSAAAAEVASHRHHREGTPQGTLLQSDFYKYTFNVGRGATLRAFGKFMASNLGIHIDNNDQSGDHGDSAIQHSFTVPYRITIIIDSSAQQYSKRDLDHSKQMIARIQKEFSAGGSGGSDDVVIQSFDVQQLTLVEQVRIAAESVIFVSVHGAGSVMAAFLSPGAALIIYDEHHESGAERQGIRQQEQEQPARTDWNLLSNAGYFRTDWLQQQRTNLLDWNITSLVDLIRHDLDRIRYESSSALLHNSKNT
jgi:Glycosyltransferase 61